LAHLFYRAALATPKRRSGGRRSADCIVYNVSRKQFSAKLEGPCCPMRNYLHCWTNGKEIIFADAPSGVLRGWNVRLRMRAVCVTFDKADCRPACNSTPLRDVR
jgi:hypothetical protein